MTSQIDINNLDPKQVDKELAEILHYKYGDAQFQFKYYQPLYPLKERLALLWWSVQWLIAGSVGFSIIALIFAYTAPHFVWAVLAIILALASGLTIMYGGILTIHWLFYNLYGYYKHALIPRKVTWEYASGTLQCERTLPYHSKMRETRLFKKSWQTVTARGMMKHESFHLMKLLAAADKGYAKHLKEEEAKRAKAEREKAQEMRNMLAVKHLTNTLMAHQREITALNAASIEVHEDT